jgi:hypothetical protein
MDVKVRARVSRCLRELTKDNFGFYVLVVDLISFFMHVLRLVILCVEYIAVIVLLSLSWAVAMRMTTTMMVMLMMMMMMMIMNYD